MVDRSEVPRSFEAYDDLRTLTELALLEQMRINAIEDPTEKATGFRDLIATLDDMWAYSGARVSVTGDRVHLVPSIAGNADPDDLSGEVRMVHVIEPDATEQGYSDGFNAFVVPVTVDGKTVGRQVVVCHMVTLNDGFTILEDENKRTTQMCAYFPLQNSRVQFLENAMVHNIHELRASDEGVYARLDEAICDAESSIDDKLWGIYEALHIGAEEHDGLATTDLFNSLSEEKQREVISYLNAYDLFSMPRIINVDYATAYGVDETIVWLGQRDVIAVFSDNAKFVPTPNYEFNTQGLGINVTGVEKGVGLLLTAHFMDDGGVEQSLDVVVPLNQNIKTRSIITAPVARVALRAA